MSHPTDDPRPSAPAAGKPTLEMLLRVKRAERPDEAFWTEFDRGLRQKQLAASIEPRPWWLGLSLLGRRLAPLGLPVSAGAAALLALMVFRTQAPGPLASSSSLESEAVSVAASSAKLGSESRKESLPSSNSSASETGETEATAVYAASAPALSPEAVPETTPLAVASAAAVPVVAALLALPSTEPTPSQLTIEQNLETVRAEEPELIASAAPSFASLEKTDDDAAEHSRVINPRHARLLAMADYSASHGTDLATVRERMVHRLAHDETNYGSSSRLAAAGDRFSLSF